MGRRSRNRTAAATGARPTRARGGGGPAGAPAPARGGGRSTLGPARRTLVAYLAGAVVLAVLTLLGIAVLGGALGPFVVLAVVVLAAGLTHRAATARLAGEPLTDEDRVMQTTAGGLLVLCVVLAAAGAVVSTLA